MSDRGRDDASGDEFDADDWFARAFGAPEPPPIDPAIAGAPHVHDALPPTGALPFETAHLAEVAPDAADAPAFEPLPTQAIDAAELPPVPPPAEPTAVLVPRPLEPPAGAPTADAAGEPTSGIDALFSEGAFREYAPGVDPAERPWANRPSRSAELVRVPVAVGGEPPRSGLTRLQRILFGVLGGLLAILALLALFLLGTRLPALLGPAPAIATPTPTPTPTPTALPVGPVAPGGYAWDELLGGECVDPYDGPWSEDFTVVDCAEPHGAQLVHRGEFPEPEPGTGDPDAFPGVEALQAQIPILCSAPGILDLGAAGAYTDAQLEGAFPVTEEQWAEGRSYFCFVSRSSGEPLTGSIAIPPTPSAEG